MAHKIYVLKVPPVGPIEEFPGHDNILDAASTEFGPNEFTIVVLSARLWRKNPMVGAVDEWGATDVRGGPLPLNRNAWALYGRSPIFGSMLIANDDDRTPIGDEVLKVLLGNSDWVGPDLNRRMDEVLQEMGIQ